MRIINISTNALSDHLSRLYEGINHVDQPSCKIETVKIGNKSSVIIMTDDAITEFIADMEYQIEFADCAYERNYKSQCQRALQSIIKQKETH